MQTSNKEVSQTNNIVIDHHPCVVIIVSITFLQEKNKKSIPDVIRRNSAIRPAQPNILTINVAGI